MKKLIGIVMAVTLAVSMTACGSSNDTAAVTPDSQEEVQGSESQTDEEVVAEEGETVFVQRRCLYAKRPLKKGQIITADDIDVLRPALGIPPKFKQTIIGKAVNKDIPARDPIFWEDL